MAFEPGQFIEIQPLPDDEWFKARYRGELGQGLHHVDGALVGEIGLPIERIRVCTKPCCSGRVRFIDDEGRLVERAVVK